MPTLTDLLAKEFPPMRWLVEGVVPAGVVLIAGKPKGGKTWFGLNLAVASCFALPFLGREIQSQGALYLALEDKEVRVQSRCMQLIKEVRDLSGSDQFHYAMDWPPGLVGAAKLDDYLKRHREIGVVVADVLQNIREHDKSNRSDYVKDYEAIRPWKLVAEKYGITLILIHHTRKADAPADVFDEVSGTLGLNGSVDQICVLKRAPHQRVGEFHVRGRDLPEDIELSLELCKDGWWRPADGQPMVYRQGPSRKVVMDILRESGPLGVSELFRRSGLTSLSSFQALLVRMVEDGQLVHDLKGGPYSVAPD